jgi:NAD(P)-dependent dehydrogenase (short-subunit alcohol dehydrogenase family)
MINLQNKIIIVTGGSGLLGKSFIAYFNEQGAITINLELNISTNLNKGEIQCDITNKDSLLSAINFIISKYHRIDGWVNNAYPRTEDWGNSFENINYNSWMKNVDLQLNSTFLCCQLVLEIMKTQKSGSIVNMASIYGVVGPDFSIYNGTTMTMPAAYSAIKGGVVNFTRYLACYFGPHSIRINSVSPGGVFNNQESVFVENYVKNVPLRRMALPNDISPTVAFLLSDNSSYLTGQNIIIDGGWTSK